MHCSVEESCGTNHLSNGLLLRADLHSLLDLGLLAIDPESITVILSPKLANNSYGEFHGRQIMIPSAIEFRPSTALLLELREKAGL